MKCEKIPTILVLAVCLIIAWPDVSKAVPMGTAFTYQGHLYDANYVAEGLYDFQFKLYDVNSSGIQLSSDVNKPDVDVVDGYFTVELDFGDSLFDGDARWLEIGVRPGELEDPNLYTILTPRQEITPAPYALYAQNSTGDSDWIISGNDMYSGVSGDVGIGTTTPNAKLDVAGGINATDYYYLNDYLLAYNPTATGDFYYGWDVAVQKHIMATNGVERLVIDSAGDVGIGTTTPTARLEVWGSTDLSSQIRSIRTGGATAMFGGAASEGVVGTYSNHPFLINTNLKERMRIDTAGNVGISTASPRGALDVNAEGDDIYLDTWTAQIYLGDVDGDGDNVLFTVDDSAGKFTFENGNVGIGTTTPTEALEVSGTAKADAFVGDGSGLTNLPVTPDTDWTISGSDMYSGVSGNVGIGTTSPGNKLDVNGSARVTDGLNRSYDLKIATDDGAEIAIGYDIIQFDRKLYLYTDSDVYGIYSYNKDTSGMDRYSIYGLTDEDTAGDSYAILGRSVNSTGDNYGVYGWATNISSGTNYGLYGRAGNPGTGDAFAGYFDGKVYATGDVGIGTENPAGIVEVSHDGSSHDLVVDSGNGFVGIGTTSPTQKLHVQHSVVGGNVVKIENTAAVNSLGLSIETGSSDNSGAFRVVSAGTNNFYVSNAGKVGIRTANPANTLGVNGSAAIGSSYAMTKTAPANGLLVQGSVGIGTDTPARMLHVNDVMRLEPRASAPSSPSEGDMYMNSTTHKLMVYDGSAWQACW